MKRRSSTSVKKILHSGHTFSTRDSFPPGVLPTKRHVIERILHLKNSEPSMLQMTLPEKFMTDGYGATYIPFLCTPFRKKFKVL